MAKNKNPMTELVLTVGLQQHLPPQVPTQVPSALPQRSSFLIRLWGSNDQHPATAAQTCAEAKRMWFHLFGNGSNQHGVIQGWVEKEPGGNRQHP